MGREVRFGLQVFGVVVEDELDTDFAGLLHLLDHLLLVDDVAEPQLVLA
jgi:hypothetical protein